MMKQILLVSPTAWDREELGAERLRGDYRMTVLRDGDFGFPERIGWRLAFGRIDIGRSIETALGRCRGQKFDGVVGTEEYLACAVASILARRMNLPGPEPSAVLLAMHKYYSRLAQRKEAPEAVVPFALIDPLDLKEPPEEVTFPMFVKPVRGTCSVLARNVDSLEALRRFLSFNAIQRALARRLMTPFNQLLARYTEAKHSALYFIGERVLEGHLVTVEGYRRAGRTTIIGVVDASMYPGSHSFSRFDYPSSLPAGVQQRMGALASRVAARLGLDDCLFNVEIFWRKESDTLHILEVNPRMAYQFADLYEKVDGVNSYDIQLALATGVEPPAPSGRGAHKAAASFVLRSFEDRVIAKLPGPDEIARVKQIFPGARVRTYGRAGGRLSEQIGCESYRYGIVNLGGDDRDDLARRFEETRRHLPFLFR